MLINQYLRTQLGFHILLVVAIAGVIDLMTSILNEWAYGLQGDYQALNAALFVVMTSPSRIYELFPLIVLIGCLTGLGALANSSELTIIRAAGVSVYRLTFKVLKPIALLLVLVGTLGEIVVPEIDRFAQSYRSQLSQGGDNTRYGVWHRDSDKFVYIASASHDGHLEGVHILTLSEDGMPELRIEALSAEYVEDDWMLADVLVSKVGLEGLTRDRIASWRWETELTPNQLQSLSLPPEKLALPELFKYVSYLEVQGISAEKYQLALWNKLLMPVMALSLVIVAVSFIFGPLREVATGTRVFVGVLVGLLIKLSQSILGPASLVFGYPPILSSIGPVIISMLIGTWLLSRVF